MVWALRTPKKSFEGDRVPWKYLSHFFPFFRLFWVWHCFHIRCASVSFFCKHSSWSNFFSSFSFVSLLLVLLLPFLLILDLDLPFLPLWTNRWSPLSFPSQLKSSFSPGPRSSLFTPSESRSLLSSLPPCRMSLLSFNLILSGGEGNWNWTSCLNWKHH